MDQHICAERYSFENNFPKYLERHIYWLHINISPSNIFLNMSRIKEVPKSSGYIQVRIGINGIKGQCCYLLVLSGSGSLDQLFQEGDLVCNDALIVSQQVKHLVLSRVRLERVHEFSIQCC